MKFLSINSSSSSLHSSSLHHHPQQQQQPQNSSATQAPLQTNITPSHLRQTNIPPNAPPTYSQAHTSFQAPPPQPQIQHWYSSIAAPQASHPATIPQPPVTQPPTEKTPVKVDQWDEIYLGVLHSQDLTKLRDLLSRTNPDDVFSLNGSPLVSQAVILTLVHRVSFDILAFF